MCTLHRLLGCVCCPVFLCSGLIAGGAQFDRICGNSLFLPRNPILPKKTEFTGKEQREAGQFYRHPHIASFLLLSWPRHSVQFVAQFNLHFQATLKLSLISNFNFFGLFLFCFVCRDNALSTNECDHQHQCLSGHCHVASQLWRRPAATLQHQVSCFCCFHSDKL